MAIDTLTLPEDPAKVESMSPGVRAWYALLGALILLGFLAWTYELKNGLSVTGMRDVVSWGAYIFTFAFFIGLSAGGLIMASSAEVFGIKALRPLARLGVLSAAATVAVAGLFIIPDLGEPTRIFNLIKHPNWSSPLLWDVLIVCGYLTFSVVDLWVLQRHTAEPTKLGKTARILAYVGLPLAISLHTVTAWIFGLQISRAWWNTSLMAPLFVVSAILSGCALVTLIALAAERWGHFPLPADTKEWLRRFIVTTLLVDLFMVLCDYVTIFWGNVPASRSELNLVLPGGAWSWVFWGEWLVGGLIPVLLLTVPRLRQVKGSLGLAMSLILVGVYCFRIELVVVGFVNPLLQLAPGIAVGTYNPASASFELVGRYCPTWVEVSIVLGLISMCLTIITVGYRRLHLRDGKMIGSIGAGEPTEHNTIIRSGN